MSNTTVMSIKTDREIKAQAQNLAKKMGFPLGTLINAFLRQFIRDGAVSFSLKTEEKNLMTAQISSLNDIWSDKSNDAYNEL